MKFFNIIFNHTDYIKFVTIRNSFIYNMISFICVLGIYKNKKNIKSKCEKKISRNPFLLETNVFILILFKR